MVDHRADDDHGFRVYADQQGAGGRSLAQSLSDVRSWLFGRSDAKRSARRSYTPHEDARHGWMQGSGLRRMAIWVTALWVLILGAYGFGYYIRLDAAEAGTRLLPTIDLLFFAFAIAGPIAMLWLVVSMLERSAHITATIEAQSESALALAATLANLNESVDALSAGTTGRLEQACDRMEREAAASVVALDQNLRDAAGKLDSALIDSVTMLHEQMLARDKEREARIERQRSAIDTRLDEDASRLALAIETEVQALREIKDLLHKQIEAGFASSRDKLDGAVADVLSWQENGLQETNKRVERAIESFTTRLAETQDAQTRLLRTSLAEPIGDISARLAETRKSLAANPPATAEALADLLGKTAQSLVRDERIAIERVLERIQILEERTARMHDAIDRTSRLNPLIDAPDMVTLTDAGDQSTATKTDIELPFSDLPHTAARAPLNWTAVVHALGGTETRPGSRHVVDKALADPDVAELVALTEQVAKGLSDDKVHLEDLTLEHSGAALWGRFGRGERGGEIEELAEIADDVTAAIVRARLRGNPDFRALALRHVGAYTRLVSRAVAEIGPDSRLIELADTRAGRVFMLISGLTGALRHAPKAVTAEDGRR